MQLLVFHCIYSWYSLPSGFNSANSSCEIRPLISTMYYLTGLLSSTGCKKTDSEFVNVVPIPAAFTGTDLSICVGDTTSIGTVPDSSCIYSWSSKPSGFVSGNSSSKVNPKITTVYYLTETVSGIGCKKSDSVIINVNPPPVIDISGNNSICPGDSSIISAVIDSSVVYQWSSNPAGFISKSAANKVSPVLTTEYYITETISSTGCKSKDSVKIIVFGLPRIPFLQDKYLCLEDTDKITLYAPAGYKNFWLKSADSSTSIIANDTGYYFLMVINEKGCKILDSAHVLQRCPPLLYMPSAFTPNGDTLNDYFRPISNDVTGFEMQIYNRWGERIYTTDKLDPGWDGTFQNEKSPAGTYLYFVTYTGYSKTGEIVEKYLNGSFTLLR